MPDNQLVNDAKNLKKLEGPTLIRYNEATRFLWGDEESHQVSDWYYGAGERISAFMFSLRPGDYFRDWLAQQLNQHHWTRKTLAEWQPPVAPRRGRRPRSTS